MNAEKVIDELMPSVGGNAVDVAEALLWVAWQQRATAIWVEPCGYDRAAHQVSLERGRALLGRTVLREGMGDAVLARFAIMAELDLLDIRGQTGRVPVCAEGGRFDLMVTLRNSDARLCGELRLVLDVHRAGSVEVTAGPTELAPGAVVGPYRVLEEIGQGGMGVVYRVEHTMLGKQFALKVLRGELLEADPSSVERFVREARAAARIADEGIVDVTDFGEVPDGRPYLVMELLGGVPLAEVIADRGALPLVEAIAVIRRVAAALQAAHGFGVVHRDLTPQNIFVEPGAELRVKIVDFGAARLLDADAAGLEERSEFIFGTPCYLSPEQARGYAGDHRADIYALGIVFYELLSGDVPFDGDDVRTVIRAHVFDAPPPPRSPKEPLPEAVEAVVMRCLRKDPAERYQSVRELLDDLERIDRGLDRKGWRRWLPV